MIENELSLRLFNFTKEVILLIRLIPESTEYKVVKYQLVKSAGSVGANYEEAQAASSNADFTYKVEIALREMRESNYWLRLLSEIIFPKSEEAKIKLNYLVDESGQLKKILGSIVAKLKSKK